MWQTSYPKGGWLGFPGKGPATKLGWGEPRTPAPTWCSTNQTHHTSTHDTCGNHTRAHDTCGNQCLCPPERRLGGTGGWRGCLYARRLWGTLHGSWWTSEAATAADTTTKVHAKPAIDHTLDSHDSGQQESQPRSGGHHGVEGGRGEKVGGLADGPLQLRSAPHSAHCSHCGPSIGPLSVRWTPDAAQHGQHGARQDPTAKPDKAATGLQRKQAKVTWREQQRCKQVTVQGPVRKPTQDEMSDLGGKKKFMYLKSSNFQAL